MCICNVIISWRNSPIPISCSEHPEQFTNLSIGPFL